VNLGRGYGIAAADDDDDEMMMMMAPCSAIQSAVIMLPVSIVLAMVFRNVRPKPTEQKLIKDLIVFDEEGELADLVEVYQDRRYSNCLSHRPIHIHCVPKKK